MKICVFLTSSQIWLQNMFRQFINASSISHERLVNHTKNEKKNVYYLYIDNGSPYNLCLYYFNRKKILTFLWVKSNNCFWKYQNVWKQISFHMRTNVIPLIFSKISQKLIIVRSLIFCNYLELMVYISYKEINTWELRNNFLNHFFHTSVQSNTSLHWNHL